MQNFFVRVTIWRIRGVSDLIRVTLSERLSSYLKVFICLTVEVIPIYRQGSRITGK